jgi:aryl-alcohol dehydrogenase-like predicted oxidoreductase
MDYRQLGRSGLRVSTLTLGTMTIGPSGPSASIGSVDLDGARRQIDLCLDAGVNLIDTADVYSAGVSEELVGQALVGRRDRVLLATKARMPMGEGPNDAGLSRHHLIEACEASLRRLRTDHIDLYQVHEWDGQTPLEETLDTLDTLVRAGKVRYIGCSNYAGVAARQGLGISDRLHLQRFVSQQIYYSLQAREAEYELVPGLARPGPGDPRAGARWPAGLLSGKYRRDAQPAGGAASSPTGTSPPVRDEEQLYDIVDALVEIARATACRPPRSRSPTRSASRRDLARHRRAQGGAARRQPRRRPTSSSPPMSAPASTRSARPRCSIPTGIRARRRRTASARPTSACSPRTSARRRQRPASHRVRRERP